MTVWFTLAEFEQLCFDLAIEVLGQYEPIPPFSTRYPNVLESCIATPQQSFGDALLYPTLLDQAAILFYLLIKNHPFVNGNKRIALTATMVFLYRNKKWLDASVDELYGLTI